ncbi:hypothetical protein BVH03_01860 [Pseudomonas sp. PA15(2017)]|uniref:hypothetical protein n=1 Tax=Pseudomonas sp. PA15(2017) TaxID=1932111 RepID=UPI00095E13C3|nr:hypothetical protein [Pseudomonas sp. PA15(2017)]OLU34678.1 hypothetical protein BVH03_01860 [Pseudomonas sp. PA15(2017)]
MSIKGTLGALLFVPVLASLAGCLAQNTQSQGLHSSQVANGAAPCTPSNSDNLISTGRSLLSIANSVLETQQSMQGNSTTYAQRMDAAEKAQRVNQGNNVLNNVESMTAGLGAGSPCTAAIAPAAASR